MTVTVRRAGRTGLLVEVADADAVPDLAARLTAAVAGLPTPVDVVPAARTVLVRSDADVTGLRALVERVAAAPAVAAAAAAADEVVIPVRYDGPDLAALAELTGMSGAEIIRAHTSRPWRAAFTGFAPGFCYLTGGDPRLTVPRRGESRPRVPAGAVAVAGGYSGVYPTASPGGWQLLGSTDRVLWDLTAAQPALIRPGMSVRFVDVDAPGAGNRVLAGPPARTGAAFPPTTAPAGTVPGGAGAVPPRALIVRAPGPLSLLQDAGRPGWSASGVGRSGAADRVSFRAANALVGNAASATVVECTLGGLSVQARGDLVVAVTGAPAPLTVDGEMRRVGTVLELLDGQVLTLRSPRVGLRTYLAVRGGIQVPPVLGSAATDLLSGLGPAPLRRDDVLTVGPDTDGIPGEVVPPVPFDGTLDLAVMAGPRDDWFTDPGELARADWVVSPQSNRVGLRLDRPPGAAGPVLRRRVTTELPSEGVVLGSIQVPPEGRPVLFLADHPVTGGYPVIAVVVGTDVDRAAQARPGQRIRFHFVDR